MPNTPAELARNVAEREASQAAAQALLRSTIALLRTEIEALPSDRSRQMFFKLLRDAAAAKIDAVSGGKVEAETREQAREQPTPSQVPPSPPDSTNIDDIDEAMDLVQDIIDKAESLPSAGAEFGESVSGRARSIGESIERTGSVSSGQLQALENMNAGLDRWLERG